MNITPKHREIASLLTSYHDTPGGKLAFDNKVRDTAQFLASTFIDIDTFRESKELLSEACNTLYDASINGPLCMAIGQFLSKFTDEQTRGGLKQSAVPSMEAKVEGSTPSSSTDSSAEPKDKCLHFFDANRGEMKLCQGGAFEGWLCYKHPDGQWVTLRKANSDDLQKLGVSPQPTEGGE